MTRQIALLRAINLGSRRRVAMGDLRGLLVGHGHGEVKTHLQSGNVILSSALAPERLRVRLEAELAAGLGMQVDVIVRTAAELADVVARNPLRDVADDPRRLQVTFLAGKPAAAVVRELAGVDVSPERIVTSRREIYVWHPAGIQDSPASKLLSQPRLGLIGTARNWNTVTRLLELAGEPEARA
jgi:uncharacterized protein (DUF1697 family)